MGITIHTKALDWECTPSLATLPCWMFDKDHHTTSLPPLSAMGHHVLWVPTAPHAASRLDHNKATKTNLAWPFGKLVSIDCNYVRETTYTIFFTVCQSFLRFCGRNVFTFYLSNPHESNEDRYMGTKANVVLMMPTRQVKRMLGLKMLWWSPSRRIVSTAMGCGSPGKSNPSSSSVHNKPALCN